MINTGLFFLTILTVCIIAYLAIFRALWAAGLVPAEWFEGGSIRIEDPRVAIWRWLSFTDYDDSKLRATELAVRRLRRGNVSLQRGRFVSEVDLQVLSISGDDALRHVKNAGLSS